MMTIPTDLSVMKMSRVILDFMRVRVRMNVADTKVKSNKYYREKMHVECTQYLNSLNQGGIYK